jgi:hypothetical protein
MPRTDTLIPNLLAWLLCAAWMAPLLSGTFVNDPWLGASVILSLTVATYAAARQLARRRITLWTITTFVCALVFSLLMFAAWGNLMGILEPSLPKSLPYAARAASLFIHGPTAAVIVAALFAYPLAITLPRSYGWSVALAVTFVFLVQFQSKPAHRPLGTNLDTYEFACMALLMPALLWMSIDRLLRRQDVEARLPFRIAERTDGAVFPYLKDHD